MEGYFDIHSHVLPALDDGSKDMEMSMRMIRMAYEQGVRYMMATPHYYSGHHNPSVKRVEEAYNALKKEIAKEYNDFTLLLGNEIYYSKGVAEELKDNQIFTLNGSNYVLVEFSFGAGFSVMYDAVQTLVRKGYVPILAHIERYSNIHGEPGKIRNLVEAGAYIQVNADTLMGSIFNKETSFAYKLLKQELVHFLGSDCHDDKRRVPRMADAIGKLNKKIDSEVIDWITKDNPQKLLNNQYIRNR